MKTIHLTRGQSAIVDDEDYEFLMQWKWYAAKQPHTFYACRDIRVDGRRVTVWMHRLINNTPPELMTDHINGNGLDNQRQNLRSATHQQNMVNCARHKIGGSRYRGVSWHILNARWVAQITVNKRNIYIGAFLTEEEAHEAYQAARRRLRAGEIVREEVAA